MNERGQKMMNILLMAGLAILAVAVLCVIAIMIGATYVAIKEHVRK